jgi:hypothetical protein
MATNTYEEALARFINGTLDAADKVGQFAMTELPQFITEALHWYFAYNLILFVAGVAAAIVLLVVDYKLFKVAKKFSDEQEDLFAVGFVWGLMGTIVRIGAWATIVGNTFNLQWLKIWIAPKLWLIEFAARLVK